MPEVIKLKYIKIIDFFQHSYIGIKSVTPIRFPYIFCFGENILHRITRWQQRSTMINIYQIIPHTLISHSAL